MRRLLRARCGAVMSEAIVAMAIIIVISTTAMSFLTHFALNSAQMIRRNEAINIIENAMECFRFADNKALFEYSLERYARVEFEVSEDVLYVYEGNGFTVNLRVSYGEYMATFMASAHDESGKSIIVVSRYTRYYT